MRNQHLDTWYGREVELLRNLEQEATKYAAARKDANFDIAAVIAGESCGLVQEILPARVIIDRMIYDAAKLLKHGAPSVDVEA